MQERIYNKVWSRMVTAQQEKVAWDNTAHPIITKNEIDGVSAHLQRQIDDWSYILTLIEKNR